jgi:predicted  nucleic acid-binding Zn-ribbon protein
MNAVASLIVLLIALIAGFWQLADPRQQIQSIEANYVTRDDMLLEVANLQRQIDTIVTADDKVSEARSAALEKAGDERASAAEKEFQTEVSSVQNQMSEIRDRMNELQAQMAHISLPTKTP